jgi:hypothetical protein
VFILQKMHDINSLDLFTLQVIVFISLIGHPVTPTVESHIVPRKLPMIFIGIINVPGRVVLFEHRRKTTTLNKQKQMIFN